MQSAQDVLRQSIAVAAVIAAAVMQSAQDVLRQRDDFVFGIVRRDDAIRAGRAEAKHASIASPCRL